MIRRSILSAESASASVEIRARRSTQEAYMPDLELSPLSPCIRTIITKEVIHMDVYSRLEIFMSSLRRSAIDVKAINVDAIQFNGMDRSDMVMPVKRDHADIIKAMNS